APARPRLRRQAARQRQARIRRLALARVLGAGGGGDRFQARRLPPGAYRAAPLSQRGPAAQGAPRARDKPHRLGGAMEREYHALPIRELGEGAGYRRPTQAQAALVTRESPALDVMTDLLRASPATIRPQAPVEGANRYMISRGVRLLLVVDENEMVLGVITATDVLGEKSLRVALELGARRGELSVGDIMTPARQV